MGISEFTSAEQIAVHLLSDKCVEVGRTIHSLTDILDEIRDRDRHRFDRLSLTDPCQAGGMLKAHIESKARAYADVLWEEEKRKAQ